MLRKRLTAGTALWLFVCALLGAATAYAASLTITPYKLSQRQQAMTYAGKTCTLTTSTADAYVDSSAGGTNFGGATIHMANWRSSYCCGFLCLGTCYTTNYREDFLKFDLSSCNISSLSTVTSATLRLYHSSAGSLGGSRNFTAERITSNWTEGGVTWNARPSTTATGAATTAFSNTGRPTWREWAVGTIVQNWVTTPSNNYGIKIYDASGGTATLGASNNVAEMHSRENGSNQPQLVINYDP